METRDAKQYKIFQVVETSFMLHGGKKKEKRNRLQTVAFFTDGDKAKAWMKSMSESRVPMKHKDGHGVEKYEIREKWVELEPEQSHYSAPLDPVFVEAKPEVVEAKTEGKGLIGTTVEPADAKTDDMAGITVTRKGDPSGAPVRGVLKQPKKAVKKDPNAAVADAPVEQPTA